MNIPINKTTNQIPYRYEKGDPNITFIPSEFTETLEITEEIYKGRSAHNIILINGIGTKFNMSVNDFLYMVLNAEIIQKHVYGKWEIRKRGAYYRISWNRP